MNCTVATEQVARAFGFSTRDGDAHLRATPPGAGGLVMLPFLNGERTPDLPLGKGVLAGLDTANFTPAHLYRAAMEGATYSLKYGYDAFVHAGMQFDRIVLTGGGSNSAAWRQLVADVFGLPVESRCRPKARRLARHCRRCGRSPDRRATPLRSATSPHGTSPSIPRCRAPGSGSQRCLCTGLRTLPQSS